MGTRRDYAISLGLAKDGRGRMSREAHEAINKAREEGMTFDDDAPKSVTVTSKKPKADKPKSAPKSDSVGVGEAKFFYPLGTDFVGQDSKGKTHTVSGRNVCRNSGYSMVGCGCGSHSTLLPTMEIVTVTVK